MRKNLRIMILFTVFLLLGAMLIFVALFGKSVHVELGGLVQASFFFIGILLVVGGATLLDDLQP